MMRSVRASLIAILVLSASVFPSGVRAQSLIRDAEIEQTLRVYATPIFRTAGLVPENVRIFIINSPDINAFVAGGSNLFLHTGLIMATDDPAMLIGVMAHETGHIAGGHIAGGAEQLENAGMSTILSYVLGAAAGIASGNSTVGAAVVTAGQNVAERNFLSFSRMNEQSADQAAISYLEKNNVSVSGMLRLMEKLRLKETAWRGQIDPYALTHPLSKERVSHLRASLLQSKVADGNYPPEYMLLHARMTAKLIGFLQSPETTLKQFPKGDNTIAAHYARAIAYHRLSQTASALHEMKALLAESPRDPFYLELKGQILAETGDAARALPYYQKASQILPDSALLKTEYARLLLSQKPPRYAEALSELTQANIMDNSNPTTWHLAAECYAEAKDIGQAALATAEEAMLNNEPLEAMRHIAVALKELPATSPSRLRAEDLQTEATRLQKEQQEAR
jgi:predicted Zn-dependent protease